MKLEKRIYFVIAAVLVISLAFTLLLVSGGFLWYRSQQQALFERELLEEGAASIGPAATLLFLLLEQRFHPDVVVPEERMASLEDLIGENPSIVAYDEEARFVMGDEDLASYVEPAALLQGMDQAQYQQRHTFDYDNFSAVAAREAARPVLLRFRWLENMDLLVGYGKVLDTQAIRLAANADWSLQQVVYLMGAIGGAVLVFASIGLLLLRWIVRRSIVQPVAGGRLAFAVPAESSREPVAAARARETQLQEAQARIARLKEEVESYQSDVAYKQRQQEAALQAQHRQAVEAERFALVQRMRAALEQGVILPLRRVSGNGAIVDPAQEIQAAIENYDTLIGGAGAWEGAAEELQLKPWLSAILDELPPPAHVQVVQHLPDELTARVHPDAAAACVRLLLSNAIEAAAEREQGAVQIDAARTSGGLEIRIVDNGPGMSAEVRPLVQEPFYSTRTGQLGLGLPRAHAIAASQGGSIRLHTEEGRGTAAVLYLPEALPSGPLNAHVSSNVAQDGDVPPGDH